MANPEGDIEDTLATNDDSSDIFREQSPDDTKESVDSSTEDKKNEQLEESTDTQDKPQIKSLSKRQKMTRGVFILLLSLCIAGGIYYFYAMQPKETTSKNKIEKKIEPVDLSLVNKKRLNKKLKILLEDEKDLLKQKDLDDQEKMKLAEIQQEAKKPVIVQAPLSTIKAKEAKDAADIAYWEAVQEKRKAEKIAKESMILKEPTAMIEDEKELLKQKDLNDQEKMKPAEIQQEAKKTKTGKSEQTVIQVAWLHKKPDDEFMKKVKALGMEYKFCTKGKGKVLYIISPAKDSENILNSIHNSIVKDAFISKKSLDDLCQ